MSALQSLSAWRWQQRTYATPPASARDDTLTLEPGRHIIRQRRHAKEGRHTHTSEIANY